jgi:hypothetical protein
VVPQVIKSRPVKLIPPHSSNEDPPPVSRAGQTEGTESRRSERVAKRLKKKSDD